MAETMLAYVYHGANDLRVERVPRPAVGPGDVLLRVEAAGICGTDLRIAQGKHAKYPVGTMRIPGHEVAGIVVEAGPQVRELQVGQRMFVAPNNGCGSCRQCLAGRNNLCPSMDALGITQNGGFAEYMKVSEAAVEQGNVLPIAESVDPAEAALAEPFATVLRGQEAVGVGSGEVVLIIGAGPIGIMHLLLARQRGARKVIVSQRPGTRAEWAVRFGADCVVSPDDLVEAIGAETGGEGADVIIVAAPAGEAQQQAVEVAAIGGRINFFGGLPKDRPTITLDANRVHYKELIITGTTACSTHDCRRAVALLNAGAIGLKPLVTARYTLAGAADALAAAADRHQLKVVITPE